MTDFSQLLTAQSDAITERWVDAVKQDQQIETADHLSRMAIRDHVTHVLAALVTVLAQDQDSDVEAIATASLEHGAVRAEQGFDPSEIAREYYLLRSTIFESLHASLLESTPEQILRAVRLIDVVVDSAIAHCFKSYMHERLRELGDMQTQLTLTNQELRRLLHANQDNMSLLAHELKTPLTSIIGYSELFLRQQKQSEGRDTVPRLEHIERVLRGGRRLLHLINDLLELSRCDAGKMTLHLSSLPVESIVAAVVEVTQPLADARGLQLVVDCDRAPETVITDPLRLQQIIMNLVSNAIRYTEAGSVTLSCRVLNEHNWTIVIRDTGIGIAPDDQSRIFDPFSRAEAANQAQFPEGTGLGLAIVARLVTLLQGTIHLNSEVQVGSTFTVVLPLEVQSQATIASVL